ncbi:MAG: alpha/beta hydrolase [Bacteriovoracia bacterium]
MRSVTSIFILSVLAVSFSAAFAIGAPSRPRSDMNKVLNELLEKEGQPIETLTAEEARKQPTPTDAVQSILLREKIKPKSDLASVADTKVQGAEGMIPVRVYTPKGKQPLPVVVYFHGGGFVIATNDVYDATPRALAEQTGAIFISVEYRKAPEHKFPAAHDDAFAAYKWVLRNAASLGGDPKRIAVAGESAGGNLAINVAIRARDEKVQAPAYQVLVYPVASNNMNSPSYEENAGAQPLNKPMMEWFVKQYLHSPAEAADPRINLLAANLKELPSATVITADIDPLRSEGKELADRLKAAGVKVEYKNYKGVTHEFFGMAAVVGEAKSAQKLAAKNLKKALW